MTCEQPRIKQDFISATVIIVFITK